MLRDRLWASATLVLLNLTGAAAYAQVSASDAEPASANQIQEIVVSAQKQGEQDLLKVPVPVAVINTEQLTERSQVRLQDYFNQVPGFIVAPSATNQTNLSIRGINTGGAPTVGVLIDDVPFGSATETYIPELDPGDLARVEVLRGPQGTLYGSDSMGGLVNYVTVAPSTDAFSGQVSAGTDNVQHGDGYGFNIRGSVNIPITNTLAIRASAFRRQEAGFIYDTLTNDKASNEPTASGERIAALWRPTATFSVTLNALSQTIDNRGSNEVVLALGNLRSDFVQGGSSSQTKIQNFSGVVKADFGTVHLTSISGYNTARENGIADFSPVFGAGFAHVFNVAPYAILASPFTNDKFSQELRAATLIGEHLDVQVGGFYTHEKTGAGVTLVSVNPYTGQATIPINGFYTYVTPLTLTEYAGFGAVTYHFTDRFDVQVGGRASHIDQVFDAFYKYGAFNHPNPLFTPETEAHSTPVTYLATPRFYVTPVVMIYARAASGYRPGGTNAAAGAPPQFSPDKTYTYEVGSKGAFLDRKLTVDLSVFYITWKDIQIQLQTPQLLRYNGNGGAAKSEGVELSLTAKPLDATTVSGWIDYDDAVLTSSFGNSPTYGQPGDRLPFSAKFSANISLRQDFPVINRVAPFAAVDASYTGDRIGTFQSTATRQYYGGFTQTNLRAGINYEEWTANAYLNNATDVRGLLNGGLGYPRPNEFVVIQPRTVGLSFTRKF